MARDRLHFPLRRLHSFAGILPFGTYLVGHIFLGNSFPTLMGVAIMSQVVLFNINPTGAMNKDERLRTAMVDGGIADCGNAQNRVKVCPKELGLTTSIGEVGRQATVKAFKAVFGR